MPNANGAIQVREGERGLTPVRVKQRTTCRWFEKKRRRRSSGVLIRDASYRHPGEEARDREHDTIVVVSLVSSTLLRER